MSDLVQMSCINIHPSAPNTLKMTIGDKDGYTPMRGITTSLAVTDNKIQENILSSLVLPIKDFDKHKEFQKLKSDKIALVGGGPSLKHHLDELSKYEYIIAAGSSYDYLIQQGIVPTYAAACDPSPLMARYYEKANQHRYGEETEFLIASCCDPEVYNILKEYNIYRWHCYSEGTKAFFDKNTPGACLIGGGCTIGLRAINLCLMLGFYNIHMFGMDSCVPSKNEIYAYNVKDSRELEGISDLYNIKLDHNSEKTYKVIGYQLAQVEHYKEFLYEFHNLMTITFHGEGLLKEVHRRVMLDIKGSPV